MAIGGWRTGGVTIEMACARSEQVDAGDMCNMEVCTLYDEIKIARLQDEEYQSYSIDVSHHVSTHHLWGSSGRHRVGIRFWFLRKRVSHPGHRACCTLGFAKVPTTRSWLNSGLVCVVRGGPSARLDAESGLPDSALRSHEV